MYSQQGDVIAEHALYWIPVKNPSEARYLTAILNAPATTELVREYQSVGLFGGRHFDTYPWRLAIPSYDVGDPIHERLVTLSSACEEVAASVLDHGQGFKKVRAAIRRELEARGLSEMLDEAVSDLLESEMRQARAR